MTATDVGPEAATGGGIGPRLPRKEDARLLSGEARFIDDLAVPGALWMGMVRSPYAHARIGNVDASAALAVPGVRHVFTGADLRDAWTAAMPCAWPVTEDMKAADHWPVAVEKACYVGDIVAVVAADDRYAAVDGVDAVEVDYDPLEAVVDLEDAASDRVVIHEGLGTNRSYTWTLTPEPEAVERAFAEATHVVRERYLQQRLIPSAIEPRGVAVVPGVYGGDLTLYSATQIPHILRVMIAATCGVPEAKVRVVAPSVGGGFGSKLDVYAEDLIAVALARRLGVPTRWTEGRSENSVATIQGRGQIQDMELAADADGKLTAVRVKLLADMGAYMQLATPGIPLLGAFLYGGVYDVPAYSFECTGVFTTKTPTDAYRGAGRPEATYAIERAMESLAREVGVDAAEIRRRNYVPADRFPYDGSSGLTFDSGDYEPTLDRALELIGVRDRRAEQQRRRDAGDTKHLGLGIATYVEMCGLAPSRVLASLRYAAGGWEAATVRVLPTGTVQVVSGATPHGQGHDTSRSQIVADKLGDDLELVEGELRVKGTPTKAMTLQAIAFEAFSAHNLPDGMEPNLIGQVTYDPPNFVFPFGTHVAVVEVDEETGGVSLIDYAAVDDCGVQVNPMIVEGQLHGGIVQGAAQALWEEAVYDDDGQLRNPTLADYCVPTAAEVPSFKLDHTETPSPTNPLGVKGIGEAGTIVSTPTVVNAIVDALAPFGVTDITMPATPERVWAAVRAAREPREGAS